MLTNAYSVAHPSYQQHKIKRRMLMVSTIYYLRYGWNPLDRQFNETPLIRPLELLRVRLLPLRHIVPARFLGSEDGSENPSKSRQSAQVSFQGSVINVFRQPIVLFAKSWYPAAVKRIPSFPATLFNSVIRSAMLEVVAHGVIQQEYCMLTTCLSSSHLSTQY